MASGHGPCQDNQKTEGSLESSDGNPINTILVVPHYNYRITGPKTLFKLLRRPQSQAISATGQCLRARRSHDQDCQALEMGLGFYGWGV